MDILNRLLMLASLVVMAIFGALVAINWQSAQRIGAHVERFVESALQLALYCLSGLTVFAALAGLTVLWALISKRRSENMRQRDGSFPLQRVKINGGWIYVDPNKIIAPAIAVTVSGRGVAELFTAEADLHLRHAVERAKVAQIQALAPGDAAIDGRYGSMYRPGAVFNNAIGKHLAGAYDKPARQLPPPLPPPRIIGDEPTEPNHDRQGVPPAPRLTLRQVLDRATPTALLVGQDDAGALAVFDPRSSIHAGVVGSTGTGKTSYVGYTLVSQALRTGYHVVLIDPKGGADWQHWSNHAEWHPSDPVIFPNQVNALWQEHARRADLIQRAGARTIDEIGVPHILVVIEEYGDLIAQLRRGDRKRADATDNTLDRLMRLSRATGIHLFMIDQYPEEWSNQVLAGCRYLVVFKLGPNQGAKVGEYKADRLPDVGRFSVRGREYNAWFAAPHIDKLLAATPPSSAPRVIDGDYAVHGTASGGSTSGERAVNGVHERAMNGVHERAMNGAMNSDDSRWQLLIDRWFAEHPEALTGAPHGISDIARRMSLIDTGSPDEYERYKGIAHKLFHEFRTAVRLPGGERLGTDVSYGA